MKTFQEFINETPSPAMGKENFEKIAKSYGFTLKKSKNTSYELYDVKSKKFVAVFDPTVDSEDLLSIFRSKANKNK